MHISTSHPFTQTVSQICLGLNHSIQGTTLWPLHSTKSFFQSLSSCGSAPSQTRGPHISIAQWLPNKGPISTQWAWGHRRDNESLLQPRPQNKHAKINTDASTTTWIYWSTVEHKRGQSFPPNSQINALISFISKVQTSSQTSTRTCMQLFGHMAATKFIVKHARLHRHCLQGWLQMVYLLHSHNLNKSLSEPLKIKVPECLRGSPLFPNSSLLAPDDWYLPPWLGSTSTEPQSTGQMVSFRIYASVF